MTAGALAGAPLDAQAKLIQLESTRSGPAALAKHAASENAETRARSARALGRLRTIAALGQLRGLAVDVSAEVRLAAAFALSQTPGSGPFCRQRLAAEQAPEVRTELYFAIGLQGTAADLPTLTDAISQPTHKGHTTAEVSMAAQAIGRMAMRGIWQATSETVVRRLAEQHRRRQVDIRRNAAFSLARINPRNPAAATAEEMVSAARSEPDAIAQAWFVRATGALQGIHADLAELYTLTAEDPATGVRIATARAGGQAGWTGIAYLLEDPDPEVRLATIAAVGQVKNLDSAQLLGPIVSAGAKLQVTDSDGSAISPRLAEATAALRALDQPEVWSETETARYSRVQVGLEPSLAQYLSPEFCAQIRMAAASVNPDANQLMRVLTEDTSAAVRIAAAERLLGGAGGPQRAVQFLASSNDRVKVAGAEWLANQPTAIAEGPLLKIASQSNSVEVVRAATAALGRMYAIQKRTNLVARNLIPGLLRHEDASIRAAGKSLARALGVPTADDTQAGTAEDLAEILSIRGARIETSFGTAVIQLYPEAAPLTVQNFAKLADDGFFDGLTFHRVVPDFVVQGGDPRGDGWGGPGYTVPDEIGPLRHGTGAVGMALSGKDTAGSQWYATLSPQPHLDGQYTVFGQVTQGLQVLRSMLPGDRVERITIERIKPISERLVAEQAHAKETKKTLAAEVRPRKKSNEAERLLAEYYGEAPDAAPTPNESTEPPEPAQPEQAETDPADKRETLPSDGETLPEDHEKKVKEEPIKEGEKVEFDASPDED